MTVTVSEKYGSDSNSGDKRQTRPKRDRTRQKKEINKERKLFLVVLGILILLGFLGFLQKQSFCYDMLIGQQAVAQVENKKEAEKVWGELLTEQSGKWGRSVVADGELEFKKISKKGAALLEGADLKKALRAQVDFLVDGCTLKVNGEKLFSLSSQEEVEAILAEYKQQFEPELDEDVELLSMVFKEKVEIIPEPVPTKTVVARASAWEELNALKILDTIYEIKKGDNFWDIARIYEMTVSELLQLNPEAVPERLMPGQEILIKAGQPRVTVLAKLKTTVVESIAPPTRYIEDATLLSSDRRIVEEGVPGEKKVTYLVTLANGHESDIEVLEETVIKEPIERVLKKGTRTFLARGVGRNYGVVSARRVTSDYGYRIHPIYKTKRFHEGIDLGAPAGTSVHAYSSGTVTFAGRTGALGLAVYISHGNGLETRYGHLSKISVKKGQKVATGAQIGAVGSTGLSTGPHLHFEVRKNGQHQNPWDYI